MPPPGDRGGVCVRVCACVRVCYILEGFFQGMHGGRHWVLRRWLILEYHSSSGSSLFQCALLGPLSCANTLAALQSRHWALRRFEVLGATYFGKIKVIGGVQGAVTPKFSTHNAALGDLSIYEDR
eukprot:1160735-Pelagomonas_calceolata.AAC.7